MFPTVDTEDISQVTSLKETSTLCSDERESTEDTEVAKSKNHIDLTLNMLFKETVICIALSLTVYGAIHSFPPKTSKVSQAVRFFSEDSVVTDLYKGQLSNALAAINLEEVSFAMYYAPWDAESQYVRGEFEKAANILQDRVHFFAINCWSPGSECRKHHSNILSWPLLIAYSVTSNGMLYRGPRNAESMVNFLELVMKPLKRVSSTEDLVTLLSIYDAVALGYTPLTETSKYYNVWYRVALESLEFDTIGEICYGVVTSADLAFDLGIDTLPSARLMLWNETKEYKVDGEAQPWNVSALMHWVLDNFTQPVARIIPLWRKAYNFDKFADGNPILMLFTPLNPLYEQLPAYALMREIAMEYYSCKNKTDPWTSELMKLQQVQRLIYQQKDYLKFCKEFKFKKPVKTALPVYKKSVISHNNKYPWNNVTEKNQRSGLFDFVLKQGLFSKVASSDDSVLWSSLSLLQECKSKTLPAEKSFYSNYEQCQLFEEKLNNDVEIDVDNVETTMLPLEDDPLSPENLIQDNVKHFCKLLQFAHELEPPVLPSKVTGGNITHIHGLACETNASLYIVAVDSTRNYHFAEALGIDISKKKDRTAVVILDSQQETQYVLSEDYNAKSVRDFIYNYTTRNLKRTLRTHVENASYTHYYESDNKTNQQKLLDDHEIQIVDLTTRTFRKVARNPGLLTLRFRVRLALCARQRAYTERKACMKDIREHLTTLIGRNLKYWRETDSEELQNFLLIRLQHLRQVSFHFSLLSVSDLKANSERENILLKCLDELARNWDIDMSKLRRNDTYVIEPR